MKTAIYMSVNTWADYKSEPILLSEQTRLCRDYMKNQSELKKVGTYTDRNSTRDRIRELELLLKELENRRVECIVTSTVQSLFEYSSEASYYIRQVLVPSGARLIGIVDNFDTDMENWEELLKSVLRKGRVGKGGKGKQKN
ncbi:MAG: hypothetical protein EOM34_12960 [Clostridia bacterium]|nr:hypothetical protein [Anaerostipes sp.]NCC01561.1 hypothetical protein [Clostridia bacterium]